MVRIAGFGAFATRSRSARTGHNPRTGESVQIPASKLPSFKPGKGLRDVVNGVRDTTGEKRGRGGVALRQLGTANGALPGLRVPGRGGLGEGPLTLEVSDWTGGVEPVWILLDPSYRQALRNEPSADIWALRLACDLAQEELVQSEFVRNAMVVLEHTAVEAFVWLTDKGNFRRDTVTALRVAMSWPDMEATEQFREGDVLREQDVCELHLLRRLVDTAGLGRRALGPAAVDGIGATRRGGQAGAARGRALAVMFRKSRTRRGFLDRLRMVSATPSLRPCMRSIAKRRSWVMCSGPCPVRMRLRSSSKLQSRM